MWQDSLSGTNRGCLVHDIGQSKPGPALRAMPGNNTASEKDS